jgi:hypothetical protein
VASPTGPRVPSAERRRILFATSNGTGLGHLARAMAIARRLPDDVEAAIFTLSAAAPVVARMGFPVEYMPSYRQPGSGSDWQWNMRLRHRLELLLAELRPDLVVFDGVHPYRALTHVLTARPDIPAIWCRRPMWRPGRGEAALGRAGAFAAVLEPGELAAEADRGATVALRGEAIRVAPITFLDREEMLDRALAERELGLEPGGVNALVALGQGAELDRAVETSLRVLAASPGVRVAAIESSLAPGLDVPEGVVHVRGSFPVARHYPAFDLAISAAGYNAFHELLAAGVPTLFVPMSRESDDQAARARWASEAGVGTAVADASPPAIERALEELLDPVRRRQIAAAAGRLSHENGAGAAARALVEMLADPPAAPRPGGLRRWWSYSAHPIGPSLPLAGALTARQLSSRPELRKPRAAALALGVAGLDGDELSGRLRSAFDELGEEPSRVLVITDSLEFGALRRLGCAFEHVPPPGALAAPEADYGGFLRRRLEEVLRRRAPRRALAIGSADPELAEALTAPPHRRAGAISKAAGG